MKVHVRKNDNVVVISGKDKGKTGEVLKVYPKTGKVLVAGVNIVKKHQKPTGQETGGIIDIEAPIAASNVMIIDPKTKKPTKIKVEFDKDGKKIRISKKSNEKID